MSRALLWRVVGLALALAAVTFAAPASARAEVSVAGLYDPDTVVAIDLTLSEDAIEDLEEEPGEYVEGTFAVAPTGGTPATIGEFSEPRPVGVRLKGNASFRGLDGKAAFKIKFNEFGGKKFLGLKRLTLNNMVHDRSMLHEALTYEAFRAAGVEAPRVGYAYVRVNGAPYGTYANVETLDDVWLEARPGGFEDPQHLYEGEYGADLVPAGASAFEVDEGDEDDLSDLEALIAAASSAEPSFSERMAGVADLGQMTTMWAAERYLGHWDGYTGGLTNNYFLLSDPLGVFQMLPWGTDQTLVSWWYPFAAGRGGTLFEQCRADAPCMATYRSALSAVAEATAALDPAARASERAALLAPWQAAEIAESGRAPFSAAEIAQGVADVQKFLELRPAALAKWLETGIEPQRPNPGGSQVPDGDPAPAPATKLGNPAVDRSRLRNGRLNVRVATPGPGRLGLRAEIVTTAGRRVACVATRRASASGPLLLPCRLSPRVRRHLAARWLRLHLKLTFQGQNDATTTLRTLIRLPREAQDRPTPSPMGRKPNI